MSLLTTRELAKMRQAISKDFKPETWTKQELNAAFQAVEDVRETLNLVPADAVREQVAVNSRAQGVQTAKDAGRFSNDILPLVEDWLAENPSSTTSRSVNESQLTAWLAGNPFAPAVSALPVLIRDAAVLVVLRLRVEAVL